MKSVLTNLNDSISDRIIFLHLFLLPLFVFVLQINQLKKSVLMNFLS